MGLSAKLCIFHPLSGNTRQLPALAGALGQGGNSHVGRAGLRVLLPTPCQFGFLIASPSARAWHLWELVQSTTLVIVIALLLLLLLLQLLQFLWLSTLHTHTHTSTLHTPSYWILKLTLEVGSFYFHFADKKTESPRSKVTCQSIFESCSVHTTPRFQGKRKTFYQQ